MTFDFALVPGLGFLVLISGFNFSFVGFMFTCVLYLTWVTWLCGLLRCWCAVGKFGVGWFCRLGLVFLVILLFG